MKLTVFGATGLTGRAVVEQARAGGHEVVAVARSFPDEFGDDGVACHAADVLADPLREAVQGSDAVISALGVPSDPATLLAPPPLYTTGVRRITEAMRTEGLSRIAVISATFVAGFDRGPAHFRAAARVGLSQVVDEMRLMEKILAETEMDWIAVRPGWLLEAERTGDYVVTAEAIPEDLIRTRHADLADFLLRCATEGPPAEGRTPAIARAEPDHDNSPFALVETALS